MSCPFPWKMENPITHETIEVPCRACMSCRIAERSRLSLLLNYELYTQYRKGRGASFITLTYDDAHIPDAPIADGSPRHKAYELLRKFCIKHKIAAPAPENPTLRKSDFQKFMKNLRRHIEYHGYPVKEIKYLCVGEYGGKIGRPHYHVIALGLSQEQAFELCKECWTKGLVDVGTLTSGGIRYVLDYLDTKPVGKKAKALWDAAGIERPFMSHSVNLAKEFILEHFDELLDNDGCVLVKGSWVPLMNKAMRKRFHINMSASRCVTDNLRRLKASASHAGFSSVLDFRNVQAFAREHTYILAAREKGKVGVDNSSYVTYNLWYNHGIQGQRRRFVRSIVESL